MKSVTGADLPSARLISMNVFNNSSVVNNKWTITMMQFGQFIAHDMANNARVPAVNGCCANGQLVASPDANCFAIPVPPTDVIHTGQQCLNLVRDFSDHDSGCSILTPGPIQQINSVTSFLDLSLIYGNSISVLNSIRSFQSGKLSVDSKNGADWPPQNPNGDNVCFVQAPGETCFFGGDPRLNQSPDLTILHIFFIREHNRIADQLLSVNPAWKDETIFEEARRINIAQYQKIVYYEWLPTILGRDNMVHSDLIMEEPKGFVGNYNSSADASTINEFTAVAFRFFHTIIEGQLR